MSDIKFIPVQLKHLELIRSWRNSDEVSKYMYTSEHITTEMQLAWFEKISKEDNSSYHMIEYKGKQLVGFGGLSHINREKREAVALFYLGDQGSRGKGIGAKIEFNGISEFFDHFNVDKIYAEVMSFNTKVLGMHHKFGFVVEPDMQKQVEKDGVTYDVIILSLTKQVWNKRRSIFKRILYRHKD